MPKFFICYRREDGRYPARMRSIRGSSPSTTLTRWCLMWTRSRWAWTFENTWRNKYATVTFSSRSLVIDGWRRSISDSKSPLPMYPELREEQIEYVADSLVETVEVVGVLS